MAYFPPYSRRETTRNTKRARTATKERQERARRRSSPRGSDRRRRRERLEANGRYRFSPRDWERVLVLHGHRCRYCQTPGYLTMDHVVPISRGGTHSVGNIVPACERCNQSKGSMLLAEWKFAR